MRRRLLSLGGFTSFDSVAGSAQNPLSLNRYLYASANPATMIDPDGHAACSAADFSACEYGGTATNLSPCNYSYCPSHRDTSTSYGTEKTYGCGAAGCTEQTHTCSDSYCIADDAAAAKAWELAEAAKKAAAAAAAAWAAQQKAAEEAAAAARKAAEAKAYADAHRDCGFMGMGCIGIDPAAALGSAAAFVGSNASTIAHTGLGVATFIPAVGSVAALADAGLYLAEGDNLDAGMSLMGLLPGGEILGKAGEFASGLKKAVTLGEDAARIGEDAEKIVAEGEKLEKGLSEGEHALEGAQSAEKDASKLQEVGERGESCAGLSFSSDTAVATPGGSEPISSLRVGDTVLAYDPKTGVTGPHQVVAVMVHTDPAIEHLSTDTGSIETTPDHPFFTTDRGWVLAGSLVIGEQIRTDTGHATTVTGFTIEATPTSMWDLTVDGAHSFFVGSGAVLVHNCPNVEDIYKDPESLRGKTPDQLKADMGGTPKGWKEGPSSQGAHAGQGWKMSEATDKGDLTGRQIRWHPGGGHHGGDPFWKVMAPNFPTVRVFPDFTVVDMG